ncbi:hypothetical protein [Roseomonas sp. AR75]|uniref:hypothetical protein n=1 Tax=Roseomonas sp. AR75 TaxID=2562311 RepID=UPI0010BF838F|nr:hypothetical protein [Roseomonas sp. AR75]
MIRGLPALLLACTLLAGCGGGAQQATTDASQDEVLTRLARAGRDALELDQPESAARLYADALERARERDDAEAIADTGFGQATALLAQGDAAGALRVARDVRADLARRGRTDVPRLMLVEATALHRLRRDNEARPIAAAVTTRAQEDAAAALRAWFLLGLIAAGQGDAAGLDAAIAALQGAAQPAFQADAVELAAHRALLAREDRRAAALAAQAATLRQDALDYRGVSRALALEGEARSRLGERAEAADLLLRAGQSAATRGERADARRWLDQAARLAQAAGRPQLRAEARRSAASLARAN